MISYIATATDSTLDMTFIKPVVVVLVSNTKDKNTAVQADSELALVSVMALRQGQERYQVRTPIIRPKGRSLGGDLCVRGCGCVLVM